MNFTTSKRELSVGDIFTHTDGNNYKMTKRTLTALAVERHYWFDAASDWIRGKFAKTQEDNTSQ